MFYIKKTCLGFKGFIRKNLDLPPSSLIKKNEENYTKQLYSRNACDMIQRKLIQAVSNLLVTNNVLKGMLRRCFYRNSFTNS